MRDGSARTRSDHPDRERRLIEHVRAQCLAAALDAYEHASMVGLCREGAWEAAVGAIRSVRIDASDAGLD